MIRSNLAVSFLLLGGLLSPPVAIAQEPPKGGPPAEKPAGEAKPVGAAPAPAPPTDANDPFFNYYSVYLPRQRSQAVARNLDVLETSFGLSLSDVDDTLRAQLEIPPGQGVVIVGLKPGSLAEQAGLKVNDVLLSLGDQAAKSWGQVKQILLGLGKEALEVKLIREGKARRMSLVGPEHGFPPEAAEFWIGTPVSPVDATLRAHLPTLPADSGLIVNDVVKGSPADQSSVKTNDILVTMDGKPLKNADALIAQIQGSHGNPVPLQLLRAGKPLTLTITPAMRAHPSVINLRKLPGGPVTYQVVRPSMAIEVEPGARGLFFDQVLAQASPAESKPSPSVNYTLLTPYTGIVHNPYPDINYAAPAPTLNIPTLIYNSNAYPDATTARIEAQLKEVTAKLDEITKALEALKKSAGK